MEANPRKRPRRSSSGDIDYDTTKQLVKGQEKTLIKAQKVPKPYATTIKLGGHRGPLHSSRFSSDGRNFATAGFDRNILIWDIYSETCENIASVKSHSHSVQEIDWMDKTSILSCSVDKTVAVSDVVAEKRLIKWNEHSRIVNAITGDKGDSQTTFLSGGDDCVAVLFDIREPECVAQFENDFEVFSVQMRDNNVFVAGLDSNIRCFDKRKPLEAVFELSGHKDSVTSISLDGAHLASYDMRGDLFLWNIERFTEEERLRKKLSLVGRHQTNLRNFHEKNLLKIKLCGRRVGVGSVESYSAVILDVPTGSIEFEMIAHEGAVFQVDFNPIDADLFSTCSADKSAYLVSTSSLDD